jgi:hypothetical protein
MAIIDINKNPSTRELAWFPWLFFLFCVLVGGLFAWTISGGPSLLPLWIGTGLGAAGWLVSLAVPRTRRPLYLAWNYATLPLGILTAYLSLAIVYFLVITPIGLVIRTFSHDPMTRRPDPSVSSYWLARGTPSKPERYFRQY